MTERKELSATHDELLKLACRMIAEADRVDPPGRWELNEKGERLGHPGSAIYLLRKGGQELAKLLASETRENDAEAAGDVAPQAGGTMQPCPRPAAKAPQSAGGGIPLVNTFEALQADAEGWYELKINNEVRQQIVGALNAFAKSSELEQNVAFFKELYHGEQQKKLEAQDAAGRLARSSAAETLQQIKVELAYGVDGKNYVRLMLEDKYIVRDFEAPQSATAAFSGLTGGECSSCGFRYFEYKGHIIPCPRCEAERHRPDSKRYRWLHNGDVPNVAVVPFQTEGNADHVKGLIGIDGDELDRIVDAAISAADSGSAHE